MANQTQQLARLLRSEGLEVELVQTNAAYQPRWAGKLRGIRALFRLLPYLARLWRTAGRVDLFHVMANSGWSWHLFAAPAIWLGWLRRTPVVVNYRGGEAEVFFRKSFRWVRPSLARVAAVIVPSRFLAEVFRSRGVDVHIVKNIIDLERFASDARPSHQLHHGPHLLITRNLEPIYDVATALRAFSRILKEFNGAQLTVCGSGPERENLLALAEELEIGNAVTFTGRLDNDRVAGLYQSADVMINPSLADNMPISILEALACGVPVVSTDVGGVPYLVTHNKTALLVPPGNDQAMAEAVLSLLRAPALCDRLARAGQDEIHDYTWPRVREQLFAVSGSVLARTANDSPGQRDAR
jgi:glycosyltransferase involved in cell wall biosynthesis